MKFLTGDDTGIIKQVKVEAQKVERLGPQRQGDAVEQLCWAGPAEDRESRVAVAYASGLLESRDAATGKVLSSARAAPSVRCLEVLGTGLLAVSEDGSAGVVREWCGDACPEGGDEGGETAAYAGAPAPAAASGASAKGNSDGPWLRRSALQGPIADACTDPCRVHRLAFGGCENDVKVFDLEKGEVSWRAKNVRENSLCLRMPVRVNSLSWATEMAPSRSLLLSGSSDGKIRLYDVAAQRRSLFELTVGFREGQASAGYTGTGDDLARPVNCSAVARGLIKDVGFGGSRIPGGSAWSLFVGDNIGTLRQYDLRKLEACKAAEIPPGRKSHSIWASKQMNFRRSYRGIMGSIRAVDVHASGEAMVAVGLGRFAYVFDMSKSKKSCMVSKVYLKQKLCSVLLSSEERVKPKDGNNSDEDSDATGCRDGPEIADGPDNDEVQEGFSDDDDNAEATGADADVEAEATSVKAPRSKKRRRKVSVKAEANDVGQEAPASTQPAGQKRKKKRRAAAE